MSAKITRCQYVRLMDSVRTSEQKGDPRLRELPRHLPSAPASDSSLPFHFASVQKLISPLGGADGSFHLHVELQQQVGRPVDVDLVGHRLDRLQPAARFSASVQNQRSPFDGVIFVRS